MSFSDLKDKNPDAIKLLLFCTFMHHGEISLEFLRRGCRTFSSIEGEEETPTPLEWLKSITEDDFEFQKATADLFSYSLARAKPFKHSRDNLKKDDIVFSIHPLVYLWAFEKLRNKDKEQYFISGVLLLDSALLLPDTVESIIAKRNALPHLETCFQNFRHMMAVRELRAHNGVFRSLLNLGGIFYQHGEHSKSQKLLEYGLDRGETVLGPEHSDTLRTVHNLALLYSEQGQERYPEAERLYKRALARPEKVLGPEHSDTLATVHNLAIIYTIQGRHPEAHALQTKFNLNVV